MEGSSPQLLLRQVDRRDLRWAVTAWARAITPTTAPAGPRSRRAVDHRAIRNTNRPKTVNSSSRLVLTQDVVRHVVIQDDHVCPGRKQPACQVGADEPKTASDQDR